MKNIMSTCAGLSMLTAYFIGMYVVSTDDLRYGKGHLFAAYSIPPYPLFIGIKEGYRFITTSSSERQQIKRCLYIASSIPTRYPQKGIVEDCENKELRTKFFKMIQKLNRK